MAFEKSDHLIKTFILPTNKHPVYLKVDSTVINSLYDSAGSSTNCF